MAAGLFVGLQRDVLFSRTVTELPGPQLAGKIRSAYETIKKVRSDTYSLEQHTSEKRQELEERVVVAKALREYLQDCTLVFILSSSFRSYTPGGSAHVLLLTRADRAGSTLDVLHIVSSHQSQLSPILPSDLRL